MGELTSGVIIHKRIKILFFLVLLIVLISFKFTSAIGDGTVYSLCQQSTQGYTIVSQAKETDGSSYNIQITLLNLSSQTTNPPIGFSIYDENGYLASAVPSAASYNNAPSDFSAQVPLESSIENVYLVPLLRQGGEDEKNKTAAFSQGEMAQVSLPSSNSKLNLRNSPHGDSSVLSSFSNGTAVLITDRPKENWAHVTVVKDGIVFNGYMSSQYLNPIDFAYDEQQDFTDDVSSPENIYSNPQTDGFSTPLPSDNTQANAFQSPLPYQGQPQPTATPAYQRAYQANQHMSAGYTVTATAQEQADRPNWFAFHLSLAYDANTAPVGNISLFYLYVNDEFFGVLTPYQNTTASAVNSSTYALNALIDDTIHSIALIPVYDGWAKGAEVIPLYAINTNALMPSTSVGTQSEFIDPNTFQGQSPNGMNTQSQPMESAPGNAYTSGGRTYTALQTMSEGYTLYATAIEEQQMNGNFTVHAFLSFDPNATASEFSAIHLYVNDQFWAVLSPYDDVWKQQWQQTAPNTFEVKIQIKTDIQSLSLIPIYASGEVSPDKIALTQDP